MTALHLSAGREGVPHAVVREHLGLQGRVVPSLDVQVVPRVLLGHSHLSRVSVVDRAEVRVHSQQS